MIPLPSTCPECQGPVVQDRDPKSEILQLYCTNPQCPGRVREDLVVVAGRDCLEIDSLGPELASKLVQDDYVLNLADLVDFSLECVKYKETKGEELFEARMKKLGFSVAAINKMCPSVLNARGADWDRWLVALNIEGIGKVLGKQLTVALSLEGMDTLCDKLKLIGQAGLEGFGDKKVDGVVRWACSDYNQELCMRLHTSGVQPRCPEKIVVSSDAPLSGMTVCVTGEHLGMDREIIHKHLQQLGAVVKTGVSKKCTHLLVGVGAGRSKLTKADELGIIKLSTGWLKDLFSKHDIVTDSNGFEMDVEI